MIATLLSICVALGFLALAVMLVRARLRTGDEFFGTLAITFLLLGLAQLMSMLMTAEEIGLVFLIRLIAFAMLAAKMVRLGLAK